MEDVTVIENPTNTPNTTGQRPVVVNLENDNDVTPNNLVIQPSQPSTTLLNETKISDALENARREVDLPTYENNSNAAAESQVNNNSSTSTNHSTSTSLVPNNNNTSTSSQSNDNSTVTSETRKCCCSITSIG